MPKYKFADLVYNITEKRLPVAGDEVFYIGLEHLDSGKLKVTRWGSKVAIKGEKLVMKKGDILFGRRNTYLRRVAIAPHDGIFSAHGMIFRPKKEVINEDFFPFFIASDYFMDEAIRISVGSLSPTVNWGELKELEFEIPSLEKQKELAKILVVANQAKENYEELLLKTDELVKSQFIEMFLSDKNQYATVPLSAIFEKPQGGEWGDDDVNGNGTPVLRTTNFTDQGYIDYTDVTTRIIDPKKLQKKSLLQGDILIEKSGGSSDKPVGRVVFFEGESGKYLNNNFTARLHLTSDYNLGALYTFYFMYINYWTGGTKLYEGKTTGIHNLKLMDYLQNTAIPLAPIGAQQQFELLARQSDKSKVNLQKGLKRLENTKNMIIQSFSNERRIKNAYV